MLTCPGSPPSRALLCGLCDCYFCPPQNTNNVIGSTTVCVASLVPSAGALVGLNMGDSGLLLLRKTKGSSERQYEVRAMLVVRREREKSLLSRRLPVQH